MMPAVVEIKQKPDLDNRWIDTNAYEIVATLQDRGFRTYLVGGCVRDLLVGISPKDFDIATDAVPQQVKRCLAYAYIIGKRFRLVLVRRSQLQYEVSTFRRSASSLELSESSIGGDNFFGTPEEDALRRDFTINGLFYDPLTEKLIDYCDGLRDIDLRIVRMIGDPLTRLTEDPIRIFRALRMAHKLGFSIEVNLRGAIIKTAPLLAEAVLPRRREEILKLLRLPEPDRAFLEAHDLGIWQACAPGLASIYENENARTNLSKYLANISRFVEDPNDPAQLFSFFVFAIYRSLIEDDPTLPIKMGQLANAGPMQSLLLNELGLFNSEQHLAFEILSLQHILCKAEAFAGRGERRQLALLSQPGFPLALKFAIADLALSPNEVLFWKKRYESLAPQIQTKRADGPARRGRHKRRRKQR